MVTRRLGLDPVLLQPLLDSLGEAVVIADLSAKPVRWNAAAEHILGPEAFERSLPFDVVNEVFLGDGRTRVPANDRPLERAARGHASDEAEVYVVPPGRRHEEGVLLSVTARPLRDRDGAVWGGVAVFRDITVRRRDERRLRASEHLYRSLASHLPDLSVVLYTRDLRILLSDGPAFALAGNSPRAFEDKSLREVIHPERFALLLPKYQAAFDGEESSYESEVAGRSYRVKVLPVRDADGEIFAGMLVIHDVTETLRALAEKREAELARAAEEERRELERRMVAADRLLAVGVLAAGIAHEINNPLTYNLLSLDAVAETVEREPGVSAAARLEIREALQTAIAGAERIREIVRNMRLLARGGHAPPEHVDVEAALATTLDLASHHVRDVATIDLELGRVPRVLANTSQLGQVFLNLLLNAAQAMPPGRPASENRIVLATSRDGDEHVVIEVRDNGAGMSPELLRRAFEPFFTTKPIGQGTGLGLSICHSIVASLGGTIRAESVVGRGTSFFVRLPRAPRATADPAPSSSSP